MENKESYRTMEDLYLYSYSSILPDTYEHVSKIGQSFWTIIAVFVISISVLGNVMIIWIVMSNSRTRSVTNFFLMNLAVADVLKATLDMPLLYVFILTQNWTWGSVTCKVVRFVGNMTAAASILSLIAVTIDRYRAIVYPFLPRLGKRMVCFGIYMIWIMSAIWACPHLIFGQVRNGITNSTWTCVLVWPDNDGNGVYGAYDFGYNVSTFILIYVIPLVIMAVCYYIIATRLWVNTSPGEEVPNRTRQTRAKRKVVKMLVIVIAIFGICWLPINVYQCLAFLAPSIYKLPFVLHLYLGIWWLAMSSSMYNPFIYYWLNDRFRYGFHRIFRFLCPCFRLRRMRLCALPEDCVPAPLGKRLQNCSSNTITSQKSQSNYLLPTATSSGNDSAIDEKQEQNV